MTKADIVDIIANQTGLTKLDTQTVLEGILSTMSDALSRGERIDFRGFGNFNVKVRKPKKARNPGTGEEVIVPERAVPVFKPSKFLLHKVNKNFKK